MVVVNETGNRYSKLRVICRAHFSSECQDRGARWLCRCECGKEVVVKGSSLRSGHTTSCGCWKREAATKHGLSSHYLYDTWRQIMYRCYNPKNRAFPNYGGAGIAVCSEWHVLGNFIDWVEENLGPRPEGYSLDRINVYGNYEPGNLRWSDSEEQVNNRRLVLLSEEEYELVMRFRHGELASDDEAICVGM